MKSKDARDAYLVSAPITTTVACCFLGPLGLLVGPFAAFALMQDSGTFNNPNK